LAVSQRREAVFYASETEECESLQISLFPYLEFLRGTRAEQVLITPVLIAE